MIASRRLFQRCVILLMAEILHQLIGGLSNYIFTRFYTSQVVVWEFSHQQYCSGRCPIFKRVYYVSIDTFLALYGKNDFGSTGFCITVRTGFKVIFLVLKTILFSWFGGSKGI